MENAIPSVGIVRGGRTPSARVKYLGPTDVDPPGHLFLSSPLSFVVRVKKSPFLPTTLSQTTPGRRPQWGGIPRSSYGDPASTGWGAGRDRHVIPPPMQMTSAPIIIEYPATTTTTTRVARAWSGLEAKMPYSSYGTLSPDIMFFIS